MTSSIANLGSNAVIVPLVTPEVVEIKDVRPVENGKNIAKETITVEEYVKKYFSDIPIMIEVAKCESHFRQHDSGGEVLRGEKNASDRGVMQINEYFHGEDSEKLGFDILTLEGNTAYARFLFEKYGLKPWKSSARCWGRTPAYSNFIELAMNE